MFLFSAHSELLGMVDEGSFGEYQSHTFPKVVSIVVLQFVYFSINVYKILTCALGHILLQDEHPKLWEENNPFNTNFIHAIIELELNLIILVFQEAVSSHNISWIQMRKITILDTILEICVSYWLFFLLLNRWQCCNIWCLITWVTFWRCKSSMLQA